MEIADNQFSQAVRSDSFAAMLKSELYGSLNAKPQSFTPNHGN